MELSTMTTSGNNETPQLVTQFDSSDLFVCRPEEYEGTLIVLTTRIEEIIRLLKQLKPVTLHLERATMSLPGNCRRIREGYGLV